MKPASDAGSFKDPAGGVFYLAGRVVRWIAHDVAPFYREFVESDLFRSLAESKRFIYTSLVGRPSESLPPAIPHDAVFFEHERIDLLSYACEWAPSMLVDAAMHTLELQNTLLQHGLSLKDATPYNIQFSHTRPIFIDLGSVEKASANGVWIAYNQFCKTFLYPLLAFRVEHRDLRSVYITHIDGLTLEETAESLGMRPFWKYRLFFDYALPAIIARTRTLSNAAGNLTVSLERKVHNSPEIQIGTVGRLRRAMKKLSSGKGESHWSDYTSTCSYSDDTYERKKAFVRSFLEAKRPSKVLDLGCNTGDFSRIAADAGCSVVAVDADVACVERLYHCARQKDMPILPLCIDLANPSPAIGWLNAERPSFLERFEKKCECVLALALLHHLLVTSRIPLREVAALFTQLCSRYLLIEYVGVEDSMFKQLLKYRTEAYDNVSKNAFEAEMTKRFVIADRLEMFDHESGMDRCLYVMEIG